MNTDQTIFQIDKNNALKLEEYKGVYGLVAMRRGNNDVWYKVWRYEQDWKEQKPTEKLLPNSIRLGAKKRALDVLMEIYNLISRY